MPLLDEMPSLMGYKVELRNVSTKTLKLARTRGWQGCSVGLSQGALASNEAMGPRMVLASMPPRKLPEMTLAVKNLPFQYDCRKQSTFGAWLHALHGTPMALDKVAPSTRARYWFCVAKKLDPETSSQRSKPVEFLQAVVSVG